MTFPRIVIIGAGVGGLTTAAVLARAGHDVTVLEAHVYPGGSAGTFYHKGYRFDAGATLAGGFYPGGPMDIVAQQAGIAAWPVRPAQDAMLVHLSDGTSVMRVGDERRWAFRLDAFGRESRAFWRWQEATADALWNLALRSPTWPPQTPGEFIGLMRDGLGWLDTDVDWRHLPHILPDAFRPVSAHLKNQSPRLREFIDAQLLISAQTTSRYTNALYGASALDLPRRGVVHVEGGIGRLSHTLVDAIRAHGGRVLFRKPVEQIVMQNDQPTGVVVRRGEYFPADVVIANLPPENIAKLMGDRAPSPLNRRLRPDEDAWGAFMLYVGIDVSAIPANFALHHQVLAGALLAEGRSIFLSLNPAWDTDRAPQGKRAITISTHTRLRDWWSVFESSEDAYQARRADYTERVLTLAQRILPDIRSAADLILPGTPVTFQRFTRRHRGWVGGYPQTSLFRAQGPRLTPGLWMVGDSIFPGQSVAAVALGGLRVAGSVLSELGDRQTAPRDELVNRGFQLAGSGD